VRIFVTTALHSVVIARTPLMWGFVTVPPRALEEVRLKLDAHVHTHHSGMTTIWPLSLFMRESHNTPERVYRLAKARGMDLVAITDHDTIDGALTLAHLPDVVVGCEVSASFPRTGIDVHLGVLDITPSQFAEIDRLRPDVAQLLALSARAADLHRREPCRLTGQRPADTGSHCVTAALGRRV
jgi:hypothetical protein